MGPGLVRVWGLDMVLGMDKSLFQVLGLEMDQGYVLVRGLETFLEMGLEKVLEMGLDLVLEMGQD